MNEKVIKSYFDVWGICCSSEIPVIEKLLKALEGVVEVTVIVPSKTVIVHHHSLLISQLQIVAGSIVLKDYLEAGTIVFLFTFAQWLESKASHRATSSMSSLANIVPQTAVIAETGERVNADQVQLNTILSIQPGDVIPIDGVVVQGNCDVDEKTLTGESFPVSKQIDSTVWAGTINLTGYLSVKTTALAEDCVVARMANLVEEAQKNKSKTQRIIDKCTKFYTPFIIAIALCLVIIPSAIRADDLSEWYRLALVVSVSACPCALVLSTPVTTGDFVVADFKPLLQDDHITLHKLLYWVASIESKSSHPMAEALVEYAKSYSVEPKPDDVEDFQNFPGEGICGKIEGKDIYVGNKRIAIRAGCATDKWILYLLGAF